MKKISKPSRQTLKMSTKYLVYVAVLVAINTVLNIFSRSISIGTVKISFTYIPCFVGGMFLGPIGGFLVGFLGDLFGMLNGDGAFNPLISLGSAMMGLIPGIIFMFRKGNPIAKLALSLALVFGVCTAGLNSLGIYLYYLRGVKTFGVFMIGRMSTQSIVFAINSAILVLLYFPLKKIVFKEKLQIFVKRQKQVSSYAETANVVRVGDSVAKNVASDKSNMSDRVLDIAED